MQKSGGIYSRFLGAASSQPTVTLNLPLETWILLVIRQAEWEEITDFQVSGPLTPHIWSSLESSCSAWNRTQIKLNRVSDLNLNFTQTAKYTEKIWLWGIILPAKGFLFLSIQSKELHTIATKHRPVWQGRRTDLSLQQLRTTYRPCPSSSLLLDTERRSRRLISSSPCHFSILSPTFLLSECSMLPHEHCSITDWLFVLLIYH